MKRGMAGGAYRGPVGLRRQKRTIRFVQILLALSALGVAVIAIATWPDGTSPQRGTLARATTLAQPLVLLVMAGALAIGAWLLTDGRDVRIPTPARLEELAGRAEQVAITKAGENPET